MQERKWRLDLLTDAEVRALILACSAKAPSGLRNRAAIVLMARAGLRVGEIVGLRPRDVDPLSGTVTVHEGKTGRRVIGLDPGSMEVVQRWIDRRRALGIDSRRPLICTLAGDEVWPTYLRTMLARKARRAGIEKRVWPHGLRHSFAVSLVSEGVHPALIQSALGHKSLATTSVYLEGLGSEPQIQALQRRKWSLDDTRHEAAPASSNSAVPVVTMSDAGRKIEEAGRFQPGLSTPLLAETAPPTPTKGANHAQAT